MLLTSIQHHFILAEAGDTREARSRKWLKDSDESSSDSDGGEKERDRRKQDRLIEKEGRREIQAAKKAEEEEQGDGSEAEREPSAPVGYPDITPTMKLIELRRKLREVMQARGKKTLDPVLMAGRLAAMLSVAEMGAAAETGASASDVVTILTATINMAFDKSQGMFELMNPELWARTHQTIARLADLLESDPSAYVFNFDAAQSAEEVEAVYCGNPDQVRVP